LTQQLLTFAKGGDPVRAAVSLPEVVREAAEFARHGSTVRCDVEVSAGLPPAHIDRAQIGRVVHNLVLNATQAMPFGGSVRIGLEPADVAAGELAGLPAGSYVKLTIADNGPGIPPEHLPRIFDPYFSTKSKNSGLGLATVHSIVKKHQGLVTVESTLGRGTTFSLWLPAADGPVAPANPTANAVRGKGVRVLFMDDETTIQRVAVGLLGKLGHEVTAVSDGAAAVREFGAARVAGRPFDVVVLDLTVPGGMGGRAALEVLLRADPEVRAIVSSGYSSDPVLANFRAYGFRAMVAKPFDLGGLAKAIQDVIGAPIG
jgi:CheY-like chemotaxis protein